MDEGLSAHSKRREADKEEGKEGLKMKDKLPSGQKMWQRSERVIDRVMQLLEAMPGTRGDDRMLEHEYRIRYEEYKPWVKMSKNESLQLWRTFMSAETLIRRRAEIQNKTNEDGSWAYPHLRPKERTQRKRETRENAVHNYYGKGYKLQDFIEPEAIG